MSILLLLLVRISGISIVGLKLEVLTVRGALPNPLLLGHGPLTEHVVTHRGINALHVTPAIWAPIFQKENLGSGIWRHVLGVFNNACLTACAVAAWYNNDFLRGVAVADGATVQS